MSRHSYIYIIYTPNLGLLIAVLDQEREQGRFKGSSEGVRGFSKGALSEHGEAPRKHGGAPRKPGRAPREHQEE